MTDPRMTEPDAPVTVERRYLSDRFKWAAPGDRQFDVWLVRFDDTDVRDMVFEGPEAEAEAWAAWERHAPGYNMRVFRLAALASAPAGKLNRDRTARRIKELMDEGDGFWTACPGCQESVDGYVSERDYPFDPMFRCQPGAGCSECGGIGVLWDDGRGYADITGGEEPAAAPAGDGVGLDTHIRRMQEACANYLQPATYHARHPDTSKIGDCAWVREFPMPDHHASERNAAECKERRDAAFIRDMIYMLDGPEQRAAQAALARPRAAVGEREAQALLVFAACARDLGGVPDDEWAKFRLLASDYRRAYVAYVALTGKEPPFPEEAHAALQSPPAKVE